MLVLALEGATDGHDSLDCQMALRKKKKKERKKKENYKSQNRSQHSENIQNKSRS